MSKLDTKALRRVIREDYNNRVPEFLGLPHDMRFDNRLEQLQTARDGIVPVLLEILKEEEWSPEQRAQFRDTAWAHYADNPANDEPLRLSDWKPVIDQGEWPDFLQVIRTECGRRVTSRCKGWLDDCLAFGDEVGAKDVVAAIGSKDADSAADRLLNSTTRDFVVPLLNALHDSKLRQDLSIDKKTLIAAAVDGRDGDRWKDFRAVTKLMRGESVAFPSVAEEDAEPLRLEIQEILKRGETPNLEQLLKCKHLLDEKTRTLLLSFRPAPDRITEAWMMGLQIAAQKTWLASGTYQANRLTYIETQIVHNHEWNLRPNDIDRNVLSDWLYRHLFENLILSSNSVKILDQISREWCNELSFADALQIAIQRGLNSPNRTTFAARFFPDNQEDPKLDVGTAPARRREDLLAHGVVHDGMFEALLDEQNNGLGLMSSAIAGTLPEGAFSRALLKFIISGPLHPAKTLLAKSEYGKNYEEMKKAAEVRLRKLGGESLP